MQSLNFAQRPFRNYRPVWAVAGAAFLVGAALFFVNLRLYTDFRREVADTRTEIAHLEERQSRSAGTAAEARAALDRYQLSSLAAESRALLSIVEGRRFSWLKLLARLERTLPPDVRVARLSPRFEESGQIWLDLSLVGRNRESVVSTLRALSESLAFEEIEIRSESSPEEGVPEGYSFQLASRYRPEALP